MVRIARKYIALLLLVVMVTNLCVWDSSISRVAHQIGHIGLVDDNPLTHAHLAAASDPLDAQGKLAHGVLHAVDHLQFFPDANAGDHLIVPPAATATFALRSDFAPPRNATEPPYRPPSLLHHA